jgi:hypothetical protein
MKLAGMTARLQKASERLDQFALYSGEELGGWPFPPPVA